MAIKALKGVVSSKGIYKHMPFIGFMAIVAMVYIANAHRGEKLMREIQVLEKEAIEEHWRYMSAKSELTQRSRSSNVENQVYESGLKVAVEPPKKLNINNRP
jgi:Na+-transporting NADH:ubiquinone oxidoreductase subunit NqrA